MSQFFQYIDSMGRTNEAECYLKTDHTQSNTPLSPVLTNASGTISPSLLPPGALRAVVKTEEITLSLTQISQKKITLLEIPIYPLSTIVIPEGGLIQRPVVDYEIINSNELSWNGVGLDGFLEVGDILTITYYYFSPDNNSNFIPFVEEILLTNFNISSGYVLLQNTPIFENSIILIPDGSIPQTPGSSFSVNVVDKKIIFGDLLPLLEANSSLTVIYYYL